MSTILKALYVINYTIDLVDELDFAHSESKTIISAYNLLIVSAYNAWIVCSHYFMFTYFPMFSLIASSAVAIFMLTECLLKIYIKAQPNAQEIKPIEYDCNLQRPTLFMWSSALSVVFTRNIASYYRLNIATTTINLYTIYLTANALSGLIDGPLSSLSTDTNVTSREIKTGNGPLTAK